MALEHMIKQKFSCRDTEHVNSAEPKFAKMPRIDPAQLLRTLSQLLSPQGGIKSAEEVTY